MAHGQKLSADGRRLRIIIVTLPIVVATSMVLYRRLVLGEEQRRIPRDPSGSKERLVFVKPPDSGNV
ncbi:hypothetical protein BD410DRAFT_781714 [Rickenella mellea]|uniref:Uncharacterized protein n=1 Tax=Rickenella mellea TaxID=50990 RepID=A0A4Y7QLN5_9AGAM|nr:hypothetical protein BD410DRAFT_781714 [Rickenella mellea]